MFSAFSRNAPSDHASPKMFSAQDLRDMFELLPPQKPVQSQDLPVLAPLVLSSRGEGLVTEKSVTKNFQNLVKNESNRLPLAAVSDKLDVDSDTTLQILRARADLALLSEDEKTVITKNERDSIAEKLKSSLKNRIVSKTSFSNEADVSRASIDALAHHKDVGIVFEDDVCEVDDHLFTASYEKAITETVKEKLDRSLAEAEPLELASSSLTENAPLWFIQRTAENIIEANDLSEQFHVSEDAESARYVPRESIIRQRDAIISELESGALTHIDIRTFTVNFKELFPTFNDASDYLTEMDSIFHLGVFAISRSWITSLAEKYIEILDDQDYVDCAADLPSNLPRAIYDSVLGLITHRVISWDSSGDEDFCQTGSFVLTKIQYDHECDIIFDTAKVQASGQWDAFKTTPGKDLKFQVADVLAALPSHRSILRSITEEQGIETAISEHFWSAISDLESQNEADFSTFWTRRVLSRQHNYTEALKDITDSKLHDQLSELLASYLQKELIPDTVAKARTQGLICSRRTQKNMQKLETAAKSGKKDLNDLLSSVEKFGKKQGIWEPGPSALKETKSGMVGDMVRRMQKPKTDGPLLFLTLIVVLFAKHHQGVVYATGKFAPKLLKLLKPKLSAEEYEQLEAWKEKAKAGTLGAEEQKAMKQMVGEE